MEKNREVYILLGLSILFLVAGYSFLSFPYLIFAAFAPIFRIYAILKENNQPFLSVLAFILLPVCLAYVYISALTGTSVISVMLYAIFVSTSFFIFWYTDKYSPNRLGYFTMILYWLAMEYVVIYLSPELIFISPGSTLLKQHTILYMATHTGIMGITAWVLYSNVLLYYALFRKKGILHGNFRLLSIVYSLILISIPAIISWQIYPENPILSKQLITAGSILVFGRTAAWVSVLIVLYSFVQRKVNK